jgi:hypothetical protein
MHRTGGLSKGSPPFLRKTCGKVAFFSADEMVFSD